VLCLLDITGFAQHLLYHHGCCVYLGVRALHMPCTCVPKIESKKTGRLRALKHHSAGLFVASPVSPAADVAVMEVWSMLTFAFSLSCRTCVLLHGDAALAAISIAQRVCVCHYAGFAAISMFVCMPLCIQPMKALAAQRQCLWWCVAERKEVAACAPHVHYCETLFGSSMTCCHFVFVCVHGLDWSWQAC
jgi:hypothetical protein